jgi:hypothetical protein
MQAELSRTRFTYYVFVLSILLSEIAQTVLDSVKWLSIKSPLASLMPAKKVTSLMLAMNTGMQAGIF